MCDLCLKRLACDMSIGPSIGTLLHTWTRTSGTSNGKWVLCRQGLAGAHPPAPLSTWSSSRGGGTLSLSC